MTKTSPAATATSLARALEKNRGSLRIPEAFDLAVELLFCSIRRDDELAAKLRQRLEREAPELAMGFAAPLGVAIVEHGLGADILGRVAGEASALDKGMGQFFTPPDLARLTVALSIDQAHLLRRYQESGIVSMHEPTIGSGAMAMAWAEAAIDAGVPRSRLYIEGWDIERIAAMMAFLQLSYLGIPARIVLGNVLTRDVRDMWETPALVQRVREEEMRRGIAMAMELLSPASEEDEEDGDDLAPAA